MRDYLADYVPVPFSAGIAVKIRVDVLIRPDKFPALFEAIPYTSDVRFSASGVTRYENNISAEVSFHAARDSKGAMKTCCRIQGLIYDARANLMAEIREIYQENMRYQVEVHLPEGETDPTIDLNTTTVHRLMYCLSMIDSFCRKASDKQNHLSPKDIVILLDIAKSHAPKWINAVSKYLIKPYKELVSEMEATGFIRPRQNTVYHNRLMEI